jgi:hypothetical protein
MLFFIVSRGNNAGIRLTPHRFKDGTYHVLRRKGEPAVLVKNEEDLQSYLDRGYLLRMSNKSEDHRPSGISPGSIQGQKKAT